MLTDIPIKEARFVAIDFESAGSSLGGNDAPVQIGLAEWSMGKPVQLFDSYLKCSQPIAWQAQSTHGITVEDLKDAPSLQSLWPEIGDQLSNSILVAHNHGTEKKFLRTFPAHVFDNWVDTLTLSRKVFLNLESYQLEAVIAQLGLKEIVLQQVPGRHFHDALFDAVSSIEILNKIIQLCDLEELPASILLTKNFKG